VAQQLLRTSENSVEGKAMTTLQLDIFRKDVRGNPVWVDAVRNLENARIRMAELAAALPGEYFVFDQKTKKVIHTELSQVDCT
jgi:hypothetical protein